MVQLERGVRIKRMEKSKKANGKEVKERVVQKVRQVRRLRWVIFKEMNHRAETAFQSRIMDGTSANSDTKILNNTVY